MGVCKVLLTFVRAACRHVTGLGWVYLCISSIWYQGCFSAGSSDCLIVDAWSGMAEPEGGRFLPLTLNNRESQELRVSSTRHPPVQLSLCFLLSQENDGRFLEWNAGVTRDTLESQEWSCSPYWPPRLADWRQSSLFSGLRLLIGPVQAQACSVNGSDVDLFNYMLRNKQQKISWYQNFKMKEIHVS